MPKLHLNQLTDENGENQLICGGGSTTATSCRETNCKVFRQMLVKFTIVFKVGAFRTSSGDFGRLDLVEVYSTYFHVNFVGLENPGRT